MNDLYERLANAIILQAVKDYRGALKRLEKYPNRGIDLYKKQEVERFFRSRWYSCLTTVDPEMLIRKLNEEVIS
jgi:hypothetical protein